MAKITNVRLPNAAEKQYSAQQFDQLVRSLEQIILSLNTNYTPIVTENTDQAVAWFEGSGMLTGTEGGSLPLLPYGAWQDFAGTTLGANINNSVTTITTPANGTTAFPTAGQILIESEIISYTGKTTSSFTGCTRGAFGTTAASHSAGVAIVKSQCLAANTSGPMYLNQTDSAYDMALVNTTQLTTYQPGVYNFQWSGQFVNSDTQLHDASIWVRINGVDVPGSAGTQFQTAGRWPANIIHDGSEEVLAVFPETVSGGTPVTMDRKDSSVPCAFPSRHGQQCHAGGNQKLLRCSCFKYTVVNVLHLALVLQDSRHVGIGVRRSPLKLRMGYLFQQVAVNAHHLAQCRQFLGLE